MHVQCSHASVELAQAHPKYIKSPTVHVCVYKHMHMCVCIHIWMFIHHSAYTYTAVLLIVCGACIIGPYRIITTAVSIDLV